MAIPFIGPLISAGASLLGGLFGRNSAQDAANQNYKNQKEFAQHGIQWKVEDAKAAGIHPLYALGANTASFSPSAVGDTSLPSAMASAGQDIGRAIQASATARERAGYESLLMERAGLENDLLRAQILKTRASIGPPMPTAAANPWLIPGQGNSIVPNMFDAAFGVNDRPMQRTMSNPAELSSEPGAINSVGFARNADGSYTPVPSNDIKQRIEDNFLLELQWMIRNHLAPALGFNKSSPGPVPRGYDAWVYDPLKMGYRPGTRTFIPGVYW